jgi:dTDP-4-dehydrorhamnose reductase
VPDDPPNPVNVYGRTKLMGERAVLAVLGDRACVLRTAWVYSVEGPSFLTTMLRLLPEREELRVVKDQVGTPTSAASLTRAVVRVLERGVGGIHHWTDARVASWYDFAVAIAEELEGRGPLARVPRIRPIPTADFPTPARRPLYSVLDKTITRERLGLGALNWRGALRETLLGGAAQRKGQWLPAPSG